MQDVLSQQYSSINSIPLSLDHPISMAAV